MLLITADDSSFTGTYHHAEVRSFTNTAINQARQTIRTEPVTIHPAIRILNYNLCLGVRVSAQSCQVVQEKIKV